MTTLNIHGILWTTAQHRNGTSFHHRNISATKEDDGMAHLKNGLGSIFVDPEISEALKEGTKYCLENYAAQLKPCWTSNVQES